MSNGSVQPDVSLIGDHGVMLRISYYQNVIDLSLAQAMRLHDDLAAAIDRMQELQGGRER